MVDPAHAKVLAVLTRAPSAGGKSRLFAALNRDVDPDLLTALLLDTVDNARVDGVACFVAVTPPSGCDEVRSLVTADTNAGIEVIPQIEGDLGQRMRSVMTQLFDAGASAVAVVGSDIPTISGNCIQEAFRALDRDPNALVLGPAVDGGYYLLAATSVPDVFDGINWGTGGVLEETRHRAQLDNRDVVLIDARSDVDTVAALRACARHPRAFRTARWLTANGLE